MKTLPLVLIVGAIVASASMANADIVKPPILAVIKAINVHIVLDGDFKDVSVDEQAAQTKCELALRSAGIVVDDGIPLKPTTVILTVELNTITFKPDSISFCNLETYTLEFAKIDRDAPSPHVVRSWWTGQIYPMISSLGGSPTYDAMTSQVQEFANQYLADNPKP